MLPEQIANNPRNKRSVRRRKA